MFRQLEQQNPIVLSPPLFSSRASAEPCMAVVPTPPAREQPHRLCSSSPTIRVTSQSFVGGNRELQQLLSLEGDSSGLVGTADFYSCKQISDRVEFTCTTYTHTFMARIYGNKKRKKTELRSLQERGRDFQTEVGTVRWGGITRLHNFHCLWSLPRCLGVQQVNDSRYKGSTRSHTPFPA